MLGLMMLCIGEDIVGGAGTQLLGFGQSTNGDH